MDEFPVETLREILSRVYFHQRALRLVCSRWKSIVDCREFFVGKLLHAGLLSSNVIGDTFDLISIESWKHVIKFTKIKHEILGRYFDLLISIGSMLLKYQEVPVEKLPWADLTIGQINNKSEDYRFQIVKYFADEFSDFKWRYLLPNEQIAKAFPNKIYWHKINPSECSLEFCLEFKNMINWERYYLELSAEKLEGLIDVVNWSRLSYSKFTIGDVEKFKDKIDWNAFSQNASHECLVKYAATVNWKCVYSRYESFSLEEFEKIAPFLESGTKIFIDGPVTFDIISQWSHLKIRAHVVPINFCGQN